jgi:hypothetical protein
MIRTFIFLFSSVACVGTALAMGPGEVLEAGKEASGQSDRALFLAAIILTYLAGGCAIRWLITRDERREKEMRDEMKLLNEKHVTALNAHISTLEKINGQVVTVLHAASGAIAAQTASEEKTRRLLHMVRENLPRGVRSQLP